MKKIPQRMCVSCRKRMNKSDLMRVVMMADGQVLIDNTGKKPGRGAYVCKNRECLNQAIKAHRFERGLKTEICAEVISELLIEAEKLCDRSEEQKQEDGKNESCAHN